MNKKYLLVAFLILYLAGVILTASLQKVPVLPSGKINDKIFHFVEFFVLAIILFEALRAYKVKNRRIFTALGVTFLALLTELIQIGVKSRSFSFFDILADVLGGFLALVILWKS